MKILNKKNLEKGIEDKEQVLEGRYLAGRKIQIEVENK